MENKITSILVGSTGVGKTMLIHRYACNSYSESFITTIGLDFKKVEMEYNKQNYSFILWDTAGQKRFREPVIGYCCKHYVILLCFSTNETLYDLEDFICEIKKN
jgi:small GTP-binding protein